MGLQRFPLKDFRGGLNTKDGPFQLQPNESLDAINMILNQRGAMSQRAGKTRFDASGFPAAVRADNIRAWYPDSGTKILLLSIDGDIYTATTAGALTSRFDGTAGTVWCFEQATAATGTQFLWAMNGTDNNKAISTALAVADWGGTPPKGTMMRLWKDRMIVSGVAAFPQRVFFSDKANPETPTAGSYGPNWFDVKSTDDDLDPVTWMELLGDLLLIFKRRSVFAIADPVTMSWRRLGAPGCEDRFQSCVVDGRCYFLNRTGVWSTDGIRAPIFDMDPVEPTWTGNVNYAQLSKARVFPSRDRRVFVAFPHASNTNNSRLLECIPWLRQKRESGRTDPSWMLHDLPIASACTFRPANNDVLIGGAGDTNKLHTIFSGLNDDGVAISAYWQTGWRQIFGEEPFERIRRVNVEMSGQCYLDVYRDFSLASSFNAPLVAPTDPDSFWDGSTWETAGGLWEPASVVVALKRARPETRARYHSLRFSNSVLDKTFSVFSSELVLRGGKEHT